MLRNEWAMCRLLRPGDMILNMLNSIHPDDPIHITICICGTDTLNSLSIDPEIPVIVNEIRLRQSSPSVKYHFNIPKETRVTVRTTKSRGDIMASGEYIGNVIDGTIPFSYQMEYAKAIKMFYQAWSD